MRSSPKRASGISAALVSPSVSSDLVMSTNLTGGFGDAYSWVPEVFKGYGAACLYDMDLKPKPAFTSSLAALEVK